METTPVTVWVTLTSARLLAKMSETHRAERAEYVRDLVAGGVKSREARIRAALLQPERWPRIQEVVAEALRLRLAEPDLFGPWRPLIAAEAARLALAGSWPGPRFAGPRLVQRNYPMPAPLATQLRTASWRVSEDPLTRLEEQGLVGPGTVNLTGDQQVERTRLAALLYPPGRIVREALERYGPTTSNEGATGDEK